MLEPLRPHQVKAVDELSNGKILCGGVGTGKSRTAVAYFLLKECGSKSLESYSDIVTMKTPKDLYIITTAKKRDSFEWLEECAHLGISTDQEDNPSGVSVQVDSWNNIGKYVGVKGAFFIFDEQRLVGNGAWVKSFLKLTKDNGWILLSATPGDTWMDYVPVFLANGFYKNRTEFKEKHVVYKPYSRFPQILRYVRQGDLVKHRKALLVQMPLERHTTRHLVKVPVLYDGDAFDRVWKARWNIFEDEPIDSVPRLFYLMRRVANSHESRLEAILGLLRTIPRLIVFYNFDYELDILRSLGDRYTIAEWNGHNHQPVPETESWVYLVQYQAGAEAWNCVSTNAMAFYSLNYSNRVREQAMGRIDRLNTPYTDLYYYTLQSTAPIDLMILRALRAKKDFNERDSGLVSGTFRKEKDDLRKE